MLNGQKLQGEPDRIVWSGRIVSPSDTDCPSLSMNRGCTQASRRPRSCTSSSRRAARWKNTRSSPLLCVPFRLRQTVLHELTRLSASTARHTKASGSTSSLRTSEPLIHVPLSCIIDGTGRAPLSFFLFVWASSASRIDHCHTIPYELLAPFTSRCKTAR
jgi:hypothetical protein